MRRARSVAPAGMVRLRKNFSTPATLYQHGPPPRRAELLALNLGTLAPSNHARKVSREGIGAMKFGRTSFMSWSSVASLAVFSDKLFAIATHFIALLRMDFSPECEQRAGGGCKSGAFGCKRKPPRCKKATRRMQEPDFSRCRLCQGGRSDFLLNQCGQPFKWCLLMVFQPRCETALVWFSLALFAFGCELLILWRILHFGIAEPPSFFGVCAVHFGVDRCSPLPIASRKCIPVVRSRPVPFPSGKLSTMP